MGTRFYAVLLVVCVAAAFVIGIADRDFGVSLNLTFLKYSGLAIKVLALFALFKLIDSGKTGSLTAADGTRTCQFKSGLRVIAIFFVALVVALTTVWLFSDDPLSTRAVSSLLFLSVFSAAGAAFLLLPKVAWNDANICATTYLLRRKNHQWDKLLEIRDAPNWYETQLLFDDTGKARVSYFYACHDDVIEKAKQVLENARTPRG